MPGCVAAWLSERQLSCYQLIGAHLLDAGQCHPVYVPPGNGDMVMENGRRAGVRNGACGPCRQLAR